MGQAPEGERFCWRQPSCRPASPPAVPGCLSAALRRALALGGWPPRVFARADIQPHLGRPDEPRALQATKIGQ
jgi:hypothetical protein